MVSLPPDLSSALEKELKSLPLSNVQKACSDLTYRYSQGLSISTLPHRYAYLAARLPATYGVTYHLLSSLPTDVRTSLRTLLDLGSGVGSLAWAATKLLPSLTNITCLEKDRDLIDLGHRLSSSLPSSLPIARIQRDISLEASFSSHDIVVLSYVLNELSPSAQTHVINTAYSATNKIFLLIEPGTPQGFSTLLKARNLLLERGASLLAPCPHKGLCPLEQASREGTDWCHFSVRIPRERFHKHVKQASLPYEDEKFTYLIVSPEPFLSLAKNRILKAPLKKTGHLLLDLCTQEEKLTRTVVSRKTKERYEKARLSRWGEAWDD